MQKKKTKNNYAFCRGKGQELCVTTEKLGRTSDHMLSGRTFRDKLSSLPEFLSKSSFFKIIRVTTKNNLRKKKDKF